MSENTSSSRRPRGMLGFTIVWLGQMISVTATYMSAFVLGVWVFQETKSLTAFGLTEAFYIVPVVLILPLAGVVVDRYNRKLIMILSDMLAWIATAAILALQLTGHLEVWHFYVAAIMQGIGNAFQWPAYTSAISTMVKKEQLVRADSMMFLLDDGPSVLAPVIGGALLLPIVGLTGVLVIDVISFVFAIAALLIVEIPQPEPTLEGDKTQGAFWKEMTFGFKYILQRPGLLGLQIIFFFGNLFSSMGIWALYAMVLTRSYSIPQGLLDVIESVERYFLVFNPTDLNVKILGVLQSAAALATVLGALVLSATGKMKHQIHGVLIGWIVSSIFGLVFLGLGRGVLVWIIAIVIYALMEPVVNTANLAIWQAKVASDLQGRVFSFQQQLSWVTVPVAPIFAGILGDRLFEPAMQQPDSSLAHLFGWLVGTGPGSGFALIIILSGIATALVGAWGYFVPAIRTIETSMPDSKTTPRSKPKPETKVSS